MWSCKFTPKTDQAEGQMGESLQIMGPQLSIQGTHQALGQIHINLLE